MTPKGTMDIRPWMADTNIRALFDIIAQAGGKAFFVGGCVRDAIVGRPVKDIDIATDLVPDQVKALMESAELPVRTDGFSHGTIKVLVNEMSRDGSIVIGRRPVDITTLRRDVVTDGRHAEVEFTTDFEEDARRRDLTINALYASPGGDVYDFFGGLEDLGDNYLRFIGDARTRICEDYLRLLRYFRFLAYFTDGPMDEDTLDACAELASHINNLSPARIRVEMMRLLSAPEPASVLSLMEEEGVLEYVLPGIKRFDLLASLSWIETHSKNLPGVTVDPLRRLSALYDVMEHMPEIVAEKLALTKDEKTRLDLLVDSPFEPVVGLDTRLIRKALHHFGGMRVKDFVLLKWARNRVQFGQTQPEETEAWYDMLKMAEEWRPMEFPVRGQDVVDRGISSGKKVGEILHKLEKWWENKDFQPEKKELLEQLDIIIKEK